MDSMLAGTNTDESEQKKFALMYKQLMDDGVAKMQGRSCWIVDFFPENLPLENKYGTTMYPLLQSYANPKLPPYTDKPNAPIMPPMSILVFADSYGFATGILKYAPQDRVGRKLIVTTPPGQLTRNKVDDLLADKWDLVLYCYGVDEAKDNTVESVIERQMAVVQVLYHICKAIDNDKSVIGKICVLTCDNFAEEEEIHKEQGLTMCTNAGLFGFCNTAHVELDIPLAFIDTEWSLPETMMPVLSSEVFRDASFGYQPAVRILKTGRYCQRTVNPYPEYQKAGVGLKLPSSGGVIAISGGNGSVALVIGTWLVKLAGAQGVKGLKIKFLSRSMKITDQNMPQWKEVQEQAAKFGVEVEQAKGDVGNPAEIYKFVEEHATNLIGYVHSAGILADGMIGGMDWDQFYSVFPPKSHAALHLHAAFEKYGAPIKFYWMFSSVAVYGNMGQLNYSTSNAVMDGIARHRRALGKNALAIQWGAWGEVGMAANLDAASKKRMAMGPFPAFTNKQGTDGLEALLDTGIAYGAVYGMNAEVLFGLTNQEEKDIEKWYRNFYSPVAPPGPIKKMNAENSLFTYYSVQGYNSTPSQGLVYSHFVKPIVGGDDD
jgi:hypothetical protein